MFYKAWWVIITSQPVRVVVQNTEYLVVKVKKRSHPWGVNGGFSCFTTVVTGTVQPPEVSRNKIFCGCFFFFFLSN